jgi:hypothetical protein
VDRLLRIIAAMHMGEAERSLDETLEMLLNFVYLARICRPGSENGIVI